MQEKIAYRLAAENDLDEICALIKAAISEMVKQEIFQWDEIYPAREDFLSDIKSMSLFAGVIDCENQKRIAVIYALNKDCDDEYKNAKWKSDGEWMVVHRLCVHPDFQRRGIAKATLNHIEKEVLGLGIKSIRLDVFSQNPHSLKLYEHSGYHKTGEALWRKGLFYLMEKVLEEKTLKEKTLYVTDLDGTLLNRREKINPFSVDAINALVEKGMLFTYATARSLVSASKVTEGLSTNIPVIAYNGTFIFHPSTGEILSEESFSDEERKYVRKVLTEHKISPLVYSFIDGVEKVSWIPEFENDGVRKYLKSRQGDKRFRSVDDDDLLYEGRMFYFTCIGEKDELEPVYEIFSKDRRYRCTMQQEIYRPEYWCEIMPALATKSNAIKKLKKMWGCTKVISFGDAINDIPMFEISDECYAVSNAVDELKSIATGIIESNDDDGVAKWLLKRAGE